MQEQLQALNHQSYKKVNLSKHIGELLHTITRDQPSDPIGCLEEISTLLWKQRHVQDSSLAPPVDNSEIERCTSILDLMAKLDSPSRNKVDTLFFEFDSKWANFGISINKEKLLMLQCSLIGLAEKDEISALRLWGLLNTPNGVLYVAEADIGIENRLEEAPSVGPYDVPPEIGVGVNRFVYYVTSSPFDEWIRLPDLRPSDIVQSRKSNWQITGDLSAKVNSFVPFDVTEDIYIRAMISRVASAATIAPQGYLIEFVPEEEEEKNEQPEEEDQKAKAPKQLKLVVDPNFEGVDIESVEWAHVRPFILPQGRETYVKPPKPPKQPKVKKEKAEKTPKNPEEEEKEEEEAHQEHEEEAPEEEEQPEEGPELFGGIDADEGFGEEQPCWNTRLIRSPLPNETFVVAESLRWPGAYNLTDGKKACSLYCGNLTKFIVDGFQPPLPAPMATEYKLKMKEKIDPTLDEERENEKLKNPKKDEEEEEEQQE